MHPTQKPATPVSPADLLRQAADTIAVRGINRTWFVNVLQDDGTSPVSVFEALWLAVFDHVLNRQHPVAVTAVEEAMYHYTAWLLNHHYRGQYLRPSTLLDDLDTVHDLVCRHSYNHRCDDIVASLHHAATSWDALTSDGGELA